MSIEIPVRRGIFGASNRPEARSRQKSVHALRTGDDATGEGRREEAERQAGQRNCNPDLQSAADMLPERDVGIPRRECQARPRIFRRCRRPRTADGNRPQGGGISFPQRTRGRSTNRPRTGQCRQIRVQIRRANIRTSDHSEIARWSPEYWRRIMSRELMEVSGTQYRKIRDTPWGIAISSCESAPQDRRATAPSAR